MIRPRVWVLPLLSSAVAACSPHADPKLEKGRTPAAVALAVESAIQEKRTESGCDQPERRGYPDKVIVVSAKQCLSCLDVGNLLRGAQRDAVRDGKDLRVAASSAESDEVCSFLAREKVRLPVIVIPAAEFPSQQDLGEIVYMERGSDRRSPRVEAASNGLQLLSKVRGIPVDSSTGARP